MASAHLCLSKALHRCRAQALARPLSAAVATGLLGGRNPRVSLSSAAVDDTGKGENSREIAVTERSPPERRGGRQIWRDLRDFVPLRLVDGLGHALSHFAENLSRPLEKLAPSRLLGRMKEDDERYRLRFEVPGLRKNDVRITVEDGVLVIHGERQELEEEDNGDDGWWSSSYYGCYHTSLLLPDDAKVDDIEAEVKDGILYVTIPRAPEKRRSVTEVKVQ